MFPLVLVKDYIVLNNMEGHRNRVISDEKGKSKCKAKPIQEEALKKAFVTSLNNLICNKEALLEKLKNAISDTLKENADGRLAQIDRKIKAEQEAIVESLRDRQIGKITEEEYIKISR